MMIDDNIKKVLILAGIVPEQVTEQIIILADHMLKINPRIATAAASLRIELQRKGIVK